VRCSFAISIQKWRADAASCDGGWAAGCAVTLGQFVGHHGQNIGRQRLTVDESQRQRFRERTNRQLRAPMRALYEARLGDLQAGDYVRVECLCGHDVMIPGAGLADRLRLPAYTPVLDLERKLRCRECDAKGRVVISIKWGAD
jgi:hypothetical protein